MVKAIFFDLDGVLVDTTELHYQALNEALNYFGYNPISRIDHQNKFNGIPTKEKLSILNINENEIKNISNLKQRLTIEKLNYLKPNKEILEILEKINKKYKIACCSNSIRSTILLALEKTEILKYFNLILSNEDVVNSKPDPEIYSKAVEYFGFDKKDCLIVEDSDKGYEAATRSLCNSLRVKDCYEMPSKLMERIVL